MLLSGGIHSFPFKLGLPLGLPSTFLGKHGWVQYFCKAALREESGLTHKNQQVFIIMNPIDLNLEPPILAVRRIRCLKFIDSVLLISRRYEYIKILMQIALARILRFRNTNWRSSIFSQTEINGLVKFSFET